MADTTEKTEAKPQETKFGRHRLSPGAYTLDLSTVVNVPVKVNGQPSIFRDAYLKLRDSKIEKIDNQFGSGKYVTGEGEICLECDWPLAATMRELIEFTRQGIDPHDVRWLYYGNDWSRDADERHTFFAVHHGKIVSESCDFNSEEPLILKQDKDDDEPVWHSHPSWDEAWEIYWYRKFYSETMTGQLMVLRPDEPILYHYERPQVGNTERDLQLVMLAKMYRLATVAIPLLAAIGFPSIRNYLAIAAVALGVDFVWLCWNTRKIGRP